MKKDWKYIAYLVLAVGIYLGIKLTAPREFNWNITYHHQDKNPFGAYALNEVIRDVFKNKDFKQSNLTPYELLDSSNQSINFLSLSTSFSPGEEDANALLTSIKNGGHAFIGAHYFSGPFADSLGISTSDYFFENANFEYFNEEDTSQLTFTHSGLKSELKFVYPRKNIHNYFSEYDSTNTFISAINDLDLPVLIKVNHGKGALFLCSTPLVFTNIYLLHESNYIFAENAFSLLPNRATHWSEYYQMGRMEIQTPLRFILTTEPLEWAYYCTLLSILVFMIFEMKRKQRIIPIMKPLTNTTLEFVGTIGNLYYQSKDHKDIAEKRISFLLDQLRTKYGFSIHHLSEESTQLLASKSGNSIEKVNELIESIEHIRGKQQITEAELIILNNRIEHFQY
jgi:hypothetical protein